jgi:hypothetical protein
MNKLYSILLLSMIFLPSYAQNIWNGGGDGFSWEDPGNWSKQQVPTIQDTVEFKKDVTVKGTASQAPKQIKLSNKANVNLELDLTVGSLNSDLHAINMSSKSKLTLGSNTKQYSINLSSTNSKNGINVGASSDSACVIVAQLAVVSFQGNSNAINLSNKNSSFLNFGRIEVDSTVKTGIKINGIGKNEGQIHINGVAGDGIVVSGEFTNERNATIHLNKPKDDGIDVLDDGKFFNIGAINGVGDDNASSGKNLISVGTVDTSGFFVNMTSGVLKVDGGISPMARAVSIAEEGRFLNLGLIEATGGNTGSTIYSKNKFENAHRAIIYLNNGRISVNRGSLVNDGLISKIGSGVGVYLADSFGMVVNNAFFQYDSSGVFANGNGIVVDDGLSLNKTNRAKVNVQNACRVKTTKAKFNWLLNNDVYAMTDDEGYINFASKSLVADSVVLTCDFAQISLKAENICQDALIPSNSQDFNSERVAIFPTLVHQDEAIRVVLDDDFDGPLSVEVLDLTGQILLQSIIRNGETVAFSGALGAKLIKVKANGFIFTKKCVLTK